jgi:DNA modification methylase
MAAERVGRICYGLELEPLYVDTIVRRWETWTGRDALHAASEASFKARKQAALELTGHQPGEAK